MYEPEFVDVVVIGAGPSGLALAIHAARSGFNTLVLEREKVGGKLVDIDSIENYPGFPEGVPGPELAAIFRKQAQNAGARLQIREVTSIHMAEGYFLISTSGATIGARSIVLATGARNKNLGLPDEERFVGKGLFYCASCDGPEYIEKNVAVIGGGDSGVTEALFLLRIGVKKVFVIEQLPYLPAQKALLQKLRSGRNNLEIRCSTRVEKILGTDAIEGLEVVNVVTGEKDEIEVQGVLVRVGLVPNVELVEGILALDEEKRVRVNEKMQTSVPLIFAIGDVRSGSPCQIAAAVGDATIAANTLARLLH